jgi:hypothetical protein
MNSKALLKNIVLDTDQAIKERLADVAAISELKAKAMWRLIKVMWKLDIEPYHIDIRSMIGIESHSLGYQVIQTRLDAAFTLNHEVYEVQAYFFEDELKAVVPRGESTRDWVRVVEMHVCMPIRGQEEGWWRALHEYSISAGENAIEKGLSAELWCLRDLVAKDSGKLSFL